MAISLSKVKAFFRSVKPAAKPRAIQGTKEGDQYAPLPFNPYFDATHLRASGDIPTVVINAQKYDSDFSQAIWSVTRFASTPIKLMFMNDKGEFDAEKTRQLKTLLDNIWLTSVSEPDINELADNIIMELFMQGGIGIELILDQYKLPTRTVTVASKELQWRKKNGIFVPFQTAMGKEISLDIPTFFFVNTDKRPGQAVADSPLLSAVQAVTFKQTVIADIQRVIKRAGYPRHKVTILEDVLRKNAPADVRMDHVKLSKWLVEQKKSIAEGLSKLNPEDAIVIFDSVEIEYLSTQGSMTVDFGPIIKVLDSQLTSALKVLPSILGKATGGGSQNIASVEAMTFINTLTFLQERCDKILSQVYTLTARLLGMKGSVIVKHEAINLRPELELEPQKLAKQNRILQLQSFGHITDSEAALELGIMHLPVNELSGTGFLGDGPDIDIDNISPNSDPLGRSITGGDGAGDTRGNESSS
jgi:hypothetical protein